MARLWSTGFEAQAVGDNGAGEFFADDTALGIGSSQGGMTVDTTIKRSGNASLRVTSSASDIDGFVHKYGSDDVFYVRFYIRIRSGGTPNAACQIFENLYAEPGFNIGLIGLWMNTNRTLQFKSSAEGHSNIGSASSALSEEVWYRIELYINLTTTTWHITGKIDGTNFIDTDYDGSGVGSGDTTHIFLGLRVFSGTVTGDINLDDVAINDANGASQNSFPGEGKIVHLLPNGDGDNHAWLKSAGGAGDANNYNVVDEVPPSTDYLKRTSGQPIDDYNLQSNSDVGIGASDTITLVALGGYIGAASATVDAARELTYRVKGQASGTTSTAANNTCNTTGWVFNKVSVPRNHPLVAYVNPQDSAAWEVADINQMQIGVQPDTSSTTEVRVSALWALVEYVEVSGTAADSERAAETHGKAAGISERSAETKGKVSGSSERSSETKGMVLVVSERSSEVAGMGQITSERSGETTGKAASNSERPSETRGKDVATSERSGEITGTSPGVNSERAAEVYGKAQGVSERSGEITGHDAGTSERAAQMVGKDDAVSERAGETTGKAAANSQRNSQLTGKSAANSERAAELEGTNEHTAASERWAEIQGKHPSFQYQHPRHPIHPIYRHDPKGQGR